MTTRDDLSLSAQFRAAAKQIAPPVLVRLMQRTRRRITVPAAEAARGDYIWDGIYPSLRDVPAENANFACPAQVRRASADASGFLAELRAGSAPRLWHDALAFVAATAALSGTVRIVDFGGGLGTGYIALRAALGAARPLAYRVIELEEICAAGRALFANDPSISFSATLSEPPHPVDIVYVNSVLQYIDDYPAQIRALAGLRPRWLLLARTAAGDVPTYATRQLNVPGQVLPHWFVNRHELVAEVARAGYRLVLESLTDRTYDQSNFPASHRIHRMRDFLFAPAEAQ